MKNKVLMFALLGAISLTSCNLFNKKKGNSEPDVYVDDEGNVVDNTQPSPVREGEWRGESVSLKKLSLRLC